jgi:hypothetical protein
LRAVRKELPAPAQWGSPVHLASKAGQNPFEKHDLALKNRDFLLSRFLTPALQNERAAFEAVQQIAQAK